MEADDGSSATTGDGTAPVTWAELLAAYREGERARWSGLLLDRLGPWLTAARRQLIAVPPYLDEDDVAQQLVAEVLHIASAWVPHCEDHWVPRRLVERAGRKVVKALLAERLDQAVELEETVEAPDSAEPELVLDTPVGKASVADLRLIYRAQVLREPIGVLAGEAGLSAEQMRRRVKSALERARAAR